jgi:hypothetical protein
LRPIASPVSVDAMPAPARDDEMTPVPGKYKPPALAVPAVHIKTEKTRPILMGREYFNGRS